MVSRRVAPLENPSTLASIDSIESFDAVRCRWSHPVLLSLSRSVSALSGPAFTSMSKRGRAMCRLSTSMVCRAICDAIMGPTPDTCAMIESSGSSELAKA